MTPFDLVNALTGRWHGPYSLAHCPAHDDSEPWGQRLPTIVAAVMVWPSDEPVAVQGWTLASIVRPIAGKWPRRDLNGWEVREIVREPWLELSGRVVEIVETGKHTAEPAHKRPHWRAGKGPR